MKNSTKILLGVIAVLCLLLWIKSCGSKKEPETITITVPAVTNELDTQRPTYLPPPDTVYITKWKNRGKIIEIPTENPVNDSLAILYQNVKDSLERYKLYLSAIQIRKFKNTFNDDYLDLTIEGEVQGELRSLTPTYTIKEREVDIPDPSKVTVFRLLAGGHLQSGLTNLGGLNYSINLGLQNQKGNVLRLGYSKMRGEDFVLVGYDFSLFQFRK